MNVGDLRSVPTVIASLHDFYGPVARPPRDLFGFFVWEVISGDALPARRDLAWRALQRIPALTPDALFRATVAKVAEALAPLGSSRDECIGLLRNGSVAFRRQRELTHRVEHPASLLDAARALRRVPGLEPSARHRALLFVSGFRVMAVDRGLARVAARLGWVASERKRDVRRSLTRLLHPDRDGYQQAVLLLDHHASHACTVVAPHCAVCPLRDMCPSVGAVTNLELRNPNGS